MERFWCLNNSLRSCQCWYLVDRRIRFWWNNTSYQIGNKILYPLKCAINPLNTRIRTCAEDFVVSVRSWHQNKFPFMKFTDYMLPVPQYIQFAIHIFHFVCRVSFYFPQGWLELMGKKIQNVRYLWQLASKCVLKRNSYEPNKDGSILQLKIAPL